MLDYELSLILRELAPYLTGAVCVIIGIIISNTFWKARIYRYAKSEILKTMEYQKNKIDQLEKDMIDKKTIISDLKGHLKIVRKSALTILGVTKNEQR